MVKMQGPGQTVVTHAMSENHSALTRVSRTWFALQRESMGASDRPEAGSIGLGILTAKSYPLGRSGCSVPEMGGESGGVPEPDRSCS